MIKKIRIKNIRGTDAEYDLGQVTTLQGPNGVGKTTVLHAISLCLAGTDAYGNKAPVHLITAGESQCLVEIVTSKAVISRSLTAAKNGTLKLIRNEVPVELSQTQLEGMLAPRDVFLSIFFPGYFTGPTMTPDRRRKVLSEILPKIDQLALLREISGLPLSEEEANFYGIGSGKRADLIASKIATTRRADQKEFHANTGRLKEMSNLPPIPEEPAEPGSITKLKKFSTLKQLWLDYEHRLRAWNDARLKSERAEDINRKKEAERGAVETELASLSLVPSPSVDAVPKLRSEAAEIRGRKRQVRPPAQSQVPGDENCPTCGQVVGKAHREKVAAENAARLEEFKRESAAIDQENLNLEQEAKKLEQGAEAVLNEAQKAEMYNTGISSKIHSLRIKLATLQNTVAEDPGPEPQPPTEGLPDDNQVQAAEDAANKYQRDLAVYQDIRRRHDEAAARVRDLEQQNTLIGERIERAEILERSVKALPKEELKRQESYLEMPHYVLNTGGTDIWLHHVNGRPFECMSTGEQIKASIALSIKLDSLLKRKINMIFVENAESVDAIDLGALSDNGRQVILAKVNPGLTGLEIN